jgi:hypothetical protein
MMRGNYNDSRFVLNQIIKLKRKVEALRDNGTGKEEG